MLKIGTRVRVHYPDYVAGLRGKLIAQENLGRWIVRLEKNLANPSQTLLLSLEASDFEVLDSHSP
ncbi:hypothetical protein [Myxosarcina sp. GI1]|uniref:hypothetical protein n=1 Tax=Myxosarcina sp. GI1 TaxID=1541065 RepID=UPI000563A5CB|nr:hypothetical protein [Myxosarcina sp. GI1]